MDRRDFFFRQRLAQSELDDAFAASELAQRDVVADILGFGLLVDATNPATVEEAGPPALTVLVNQFLGYDQTGRRIGNARSAFQGGTIVGTTVPHTVDMTIDEVGAATTVTTPGNERILTIFLEFFRRTSDPRTDGNATTVFFVQEESVQFNVVQSAEAAAGLGVPAVLRPDQLIIADVTRLFGQTTFLNADIDQSRRQNFALSLLHGASHAENGTDPIPNASPVAGQGGLISGVDQAKLDDVDFSASGIGTRLANTHYRDFQPANGVAPAATTIDVTGLLVGKSATGTPLVEGVVVTGPDNTVIITDSDNDDFIDPEGNKVYGRLTEAAAVWTLSFFSNIDGSGETAFDMTPFSGSAFRWLIMEAFFIHNVPSANPQRVIPSDQVAAEVPDMSETQKGITTFATDGEVIGFKAVQANDSRLGGVGVVPVGGVIDWWRPNTTDPVPTNFMFCDGTVVADGASPFNGLAVPDLRNQFTRGVNALAGYGGPGAPATGGSDTHTHTTDSQGSHSHNVTGHTHGLTAHTHSISSDGAHTHNVTVAGAGVGISIDGLVGAPTNVQSPTTHNHGGVTGGGTGTTDSAGSATDSQGAHTHTALAGSTLPAYVGLAKIIRFK